MKFLFLDIDGVLNNKNTYTMFNLCKPENYGLDDECVQNTKNIINATKCSIVWITNWRKADDDHIWKFYYDHEEYSFHSPFKKARDSFSSTKQLICPHITHASKSTDIKKYFEEFSDRNRLKFAIVDDDLSQGLQEEFPNDFFRSDSMYGMTKKLSERIIDHLK